MRGDWFSGEEHRSFRFNGEHGGALLLHGFMGTPKEMRPLGEMLNQSGVTAWGPLLPGFGEQISSIHDVRREDWIDHAGQIWEEMHRIGQANLLIGFSMGGAVALHLAERCAPDRLILMAPLWRVMGGDWKLYLLPVVKRLVSRLKPFARADLDEPGVRQFFADAMPDLDLDDPDVRDAVRNEIEISTSTLDELRRLASEAGEIAPRIRVPTLVIQGTDDGSVRPEDTRELVSNMGSNTSLREISAGHMLVSDEQPSWSAVRQMVTDFANGATS